MAITIRITIVPFVVLLLAALASASRISIVNGCSRSLNVVIRTSRGSIGTSGLTLGPGRTSRVLMPTNGWIGTIGLGSNSLLAELNINSGGQDFYDISAVEGFTLGTGMSLTGPGRSASCSANRNICPAANVQGNACVNPNRDDGNTQYAKNVRASCPTVYSWAKDDGKSIVGPTGRSFTVRFCP